MSSFNLDHLHNIRCSTWAN